MGTKRAHGLVTAAVVLVGLVLTPPWAASEKERPGGDDFWRGQLDEGKLTSAPLPRRPRWRTVARPFRHSTPGAENMDAQRLSLAYQLAAHIPHIYSMLVIRNGHLVAEQYFDEPTRSTPRPVASVGKSILGALVGIALEEGYLTDLDQRMIDFFSEYDLPSIDPRKRDITIRQLVQMRAGYPFDSTMEFFDPLTRSNDWMRFIIVNWDLERAPGTGWDYSSASAHLLSGILTKATGMSLIEFANRHLFGPMGQPIEYWPRDPQGYCVGPGDVHCTPTQLASFGQMILHRGWWRDRRVVPAAWIEDSLVDYSTTWYGDDIWPYRNIRYGYLWWHAEVRGHDIYFAWGHGGQFVSIAPELELVVVTTAYNFVGDFTDNSWNTEGAIMRLIATDVIPAAN
jgi:CubicO group peptidase (beta-lactamase class C family)